MGKVILAILLSLLFPGLGQLFAKQRVRGVVLICAGILFFYLSKAGIVLPLLLLRLGSAFAAGMTANRKVKKGALQGFLPAGRATAEISLAFVITVSLTFLPYSFVVKPYVHAKMYPKATETEKSDMEEKTISYLIDKYGQTAEISAVDYDSLNREYRMTAVLEEQSQIEFPVYYSEQKDEMKDFYMQRVWADEFDKAIRPAVEKEFPHIWQYSSSVFVSEEALKAVDPKEPPSYEKLRKDHPDGYDHKLSIYLFEDMDASNKEEKLKKVLNIINEIKEQGVGKIQFGIVFYKEKLLEEKGSGISVSSEFSGYEQYSLRLGDDAVREIENWQDLEKYLR